MSAQNLALPCRLLCFERCREGCFKPVKRPHRGCLAHSVEKTQGVLESLGDRILCHADHCGAGTTEQAPKNPG